MSNISNEITKLSCDILEYYYLRDIKCLQEKEKERKQKKSRKGKLWARSWILRREMLGASSTLIKELREEDPRSYRTFLRMNEESFNELLGMLDPILQRQDTKMRNALQLSLKLEITLRYLATGDSFETLSKMFRVPQGSISLFLPEILDNIKEKLSSFIKVSDHSLYRFLHSDMAPPHHSLKY